MKKNNSSKYPHWEPYLDKTQSKVLFITLSKILREYGTIQIDGFVVELDLGDDKVITINLTNLVRTCKAQPVKIWRKLVANFVDRSLIDFLQDFGFVKDRLTIQLYLGAVENKETLQLVKQVDLAEVYSVPALLLGELYVYLNHDLLARMRKSEAEVMGLALANLKAKAKLEIASYSKDNGFPYFLTNTTEPDNTAACALILEDYPEHIGQYGVLVSVPNRDMLIVYPINDPSKAHSMAVKMTLQVLAEYESEYAVSEYCYYYHNGIFSKLDYRVNKDTHLLEFKLTPDHPFKQFTEKSDESQS